MMTGHARAPPYSCSRSSSAGTVAVGNRVTTGAYGMPAVIVVRTELTAPHAAIVITATLNEGMPSISRPVQKLRRARSRSAAETRRTAAMPATNAAIDSAKKPPHAARPARYRTSSTRNVTNSARSATGFAERVKARVAAADASTTAPILVPARVAPGRR